ncbi:MAG: hypothetical protein ABW023_13940, partial [Sphingomonas sp.]
MTAIRRYFAFFLFLVFFASPAAGQTLQGWQALETAVANQSVGQFAALNGRQFPVTLSGATDRGITLTPAAAFSVARTDNRFVITIVNAELLLERLPGNIARKREISWEVSFGSGSIFGLAIEGVDECLFSLTFNQVGGEILDLNAMRSDDDVSWT